MSEMPRFYRDAERRAKEQGKTTEQVLAEDRKRFRQGLANTNLSHCLSPANIKRVILNHPDDAEWRSQILAHAHTCEHCAVSLMIAEPEKFGKMFIPNDTE